VYGSGYRGEVSGPYGLGYRGKVAGPNAEVAGDLGRFGVGGWGVRIGG